MERITEFSTDHAGTFPALFLMSSDSSAPAANRHMNVWVHPRTDRYAVLTSSMLSHLNAETSRLREQIALLHAQLQHQGSMIETLTEDLDRADTNVRVLRAELEIAELETEEADRRNRQLIDSINRLLWEAPEEVRQREFRTIRDIIHGPAIPEREEDLFAREDLEEEEREQVRRQLVFDDL